METNLSRHHRRSRSNKKKNLEQSCSRVGADYQCEVSPWRPLCEVSRWKPPSPSSSATKNNIGKETGSSFKEADIVVTENSFKCTCVWDPSRMDPEIVDRYLSHFDTRLYEEALQCLLESNYVVPHALSRMFRNYSQTNSLLGLLNAGQKMAKRLSWDSWSAAEAHAFTTAMFSVGERNFLAVSRLMKDGPGSSRSLADILAYYYGRWKFSKDCVQWKKFRRLRVEEDEVDFHNDYCERCKNGGDLICCDTCNAAIHMKCIQPEVTEIPDKWSCEVCCRSFRTEADMQSAVAFVQEQLKKSDEKKKRLWEREGRKSPISGKFLGKRKVGIENVYTQRKSAKI
eukprot:g4099.t1